MSGLRCSEFSHCLIRTAKLFMGERSLVAR
jgi:hypothetical protein